MEGQKLSTIFVPSRNQVEISSVYFLTFKDKHNLRWMTFTMFLWTILLSLITAYWYGSVGFWLNFILTFPFLRDLGHKIIKARLKRQHHCESVEDPLRYQTKGW